MSADGTDLVFGWKQETKTSDNPLPAYTGDRITSPSGCVVNSCLVSENGLYSACSAGFNWSFFDYMAPRSLGVYQQLGFGFKSLWANQDAVFSHTGQFCMRDDGNLVASTPNSEWTTNSASPGNAPFTLVMQNDGNLVIYDKTQKAIWATGTSQLYAVPPAK